MAGQSRLRLGHFILGITMLSVAALGAIVFYGQRLLASEFPDVSIIKTQYPYVIYQGPKLPPRIEIHAKRPSTWVSLNAISPAARGAILVSEDWAFWQHHGYDANQIREAMKEDLEEGHFVRGASTITQQVARNVFLDKDKNLWRKVKELYLATQLESHLGKSRILEVYFNVAEWGEGIFGIGPAARHYFNKSPSELTAKEGAFLAMLLPSPKRYGVSFRAKKLTGYARSTVNDILSKMAQAHYITDDERDAQMRQSLPFEAIAEAPAPGPSDEAGTAPPSQTPAPSQSGAQTGDSSPDNPI